MQTLVFKLHHLKDFYFLFYWLDDEEMENKSSRDNFQRKRHEQGD